MDLRHFVYPNMGGICWPTTFGHGWGHTPHPLTSGRKPTSGQWSTTKCFLWGSQTSFVLLTLFRRVILGTHLPCSGAWGPHSSGNGNVSLGVTVLPCVSLIGPGTTPAHSPLALGRAVKPLIRPVTWSSNPTQQNWGYAIAFLHSKFSQKHNVSSVRTQESVLVPPPPFRSHFHEKLYNFKVLYLYISQKSVKQIDDN